ncbi:hypothetical protein [Endozoicomonas sp. ALB091]|uniref:hypothetical protein n=1 Tax=Endozoicomonas sp. ALB091 TaxID=3403073 RepID=UPI003BB68BBB
MLDQDWLKHPSIRQLSPEARGVLSDLILLSRLPGESQDGILTEFDLPLTLDEIASHIHTDRRYLRRLLPSLKQNGLLRESPKGYYLPSIVREANRRQRRIENGRKGGNPSLKATEKASAPTFYRRPQQLSPQVQLERKQFGKFWYHYPNKTHGIPARAAFHMERFYQREDDYLLLMEHLLNRIDPMVGDIRWKNRPDQIPEAATFLRKALWQQSYRPIMETL